MSEQKLIPAATILMVRDAPALEVLMVERHHQIDFASGALVFPGGKTAAGDCDPAWAAHCDGYDLEHSDFRISAVREAFEESGVLLARRTDARGVGAPLAPANATASIANMREAVDKGQANFLEVVRGAGLVLALDTLVPYAHWITPDMMPKRFDTRFYIAAAPADQVAVHDGREAVDACWIAPADALKAAQEGRRTIIFPTRVNVEMLAQSRNVAEALEAARTRRIVTVEPKVVREAEGQMLVIPADAGYSVTREPLSSVKP